MKVDKGIDNIMDDDTPGENRDSVDVRPIVTFLSNKPSVDEPQSGIDQRSSYQQNEMRKPFISIGPKYIEHRKPPYAHGVSGSGSGRFLYQQSIQQQHHQTSEQNLFTMNNMTSRSTQRSMNFQK